MKGAIGKLKQEAAKGLLGHRVKQPPILFDCSDVRRTLSKLVTYAKRHYF